MKSSSISSPAAAVPHNICLLGEISFTVGLMETTSSTLATIIVEITNWLVHFRRPFMHAHDAQGTVTVLVSTCLTHLQTGTAFCARVDNIYGSTCAPSACNGPA